VEGGLARRSLCCARTLARAQMRVRIAKQARAAPVRHLSFTRQMYCCRYFYLRYNICGCRARALALSGDAVSTPRTCRQVVTCWECFGEAPPPPPLLGRPQGCLPRAAVFHRRARCPTAAPVRSGVALRSRRLARAADSRGQSSTWRRRCRGSVRAPA
jgi:hypothetical protein